MVCENAAQLVRELHEQGYVGSRKMVATWVTTTTAKVARKDRTRTQRPDAHEVHRVPQQEPGHELGHNADAQGRQQTLSPPKQRTEHPANRYNSVTSLATGMNSLNMAEQATLEKQLQQANSQTWPRGTHCYRSSHRWCVQRTGKEQLDN